MLNNHRSEVACFREQVERTEQAAQLGLYGFAISATHESITARMERGGQHILSLIQEGRQAEAIRLMNSENWGIEELEGLESAGRQTTRERMRQNEPTTSAW